MEYKIVPFVATLNQQQQNTNIVAQQLEDLVKNYVS